MKSKKRNKPQFASAYVLSGKKKYQVVITTWTSEIRANLKTFALPSERHLRTGQPDGVIRDGSTEELVCKAVSASAPFLVDGRVKFPDWVGKTLSLNRRRYTIVETTSVEQRGFISFDFKAVRYTHEHRIISYL